MRPATDKCPRPDLAKHGACGCRECGRKLVDAYAPDVRKIASDTNKTLQAFGAKPVNFAT